MPIYEYKCQLCGAIWESIRPIRDRAKPLTCLCTGQADVIQSVPARADFRGEGWTPIHHPGPQD